jgi:hypothetical protein
MARTLHAGTAETVDPLDRVSWYSLQRSGQTPHHRCAERRFWVDSAVPPLPIGARADGRERPWRGRKRRKTGRNVLRWTARDSRAMLHETLLRGQASAVPARNAALGALAPRRGWTRERRQRLVLRFDGGFGTTAVLHGRRSRGSHVVTKLRPSGRGRQVRQAVGPWQPTSSPGRELAAVVHPHRCCRATRPWVIRTPREQGGAQ